jgi:carboxypeptidase PM20D1
MRAKIFYGKPSSLFFDVQLLGDDGARNIAALLQQRGIDFEFILDEGSVILKGSALGIQKPIAL